jgi:putative tryptophan/tyrosine transport system substrate-binding protein
MHSRPTGWRIGVLMGIAEHDAEARSCTEALRQALQELGWTEDRNLHVDYRFTTGGLDVLRASVAELLAQQPELIVARGTPVVAELRRQSSTIPIVFTLVGDPIGGGFIKSWAQPGGNITGFVNFEPSMSTKWLELLKEVAPVVNQVAALFNPDTAPGHGAYFLKPMENATPLFGMKLINAAVHNEREIESTLAKLSAEPGVGLVAMPDFFTTIHHQQIVALAVHHRLPAVYPYRYFIASGGLISYGADTPDLYRRAATYVDRILHGASPGELPIQQPTKFELVINLKTAKALGLIIPPALLARADEVIE